MAPLQPAWQPAVAVRRSGAGRWPVLALSRRLAVDAPAVQPTPVTVVARLYQAKAQAARQAMALRLRPPPAAALQPVVPQLVRAAPPAPIAAGSPARRVVERNWCQAPPQAAAAQPQWRVCPAPSRAPRQAAPERAFQRPVRSDPSRSAPPQADWQNRLPAAGPFPCSAMRAAAGARRSQQMRRVKRLASRSLLCVRQQQASCQGATRLYRLRFRKGGRNCRVTPARMASHATRGAARFPRNRHDGAGTAHA